MVLTINLEPHVEEKLRCLAEKENIPLPEYGARELNRIAQEENPDELPGEFILRIAAEARAEVPREEWDNVPKDLARNYKHYLYGHIKEAAGFRTGEG